MLRLDVIAQSPAQVVLQAAGRFGGRAELEVVKSEVTRHLGQARRVVLDLKYVESVDYDGLDCLQGLVQPRPAARGRPQVRVCVRDGSRFLRALLQSRGIPLH